MSVLNRIVGGEQCKKDGTLYLSKASQREVELWYSLNLDRSVFWNHHRTN